MAASNSCVVPTQPMFVHATDMSATSGTGVLLVVDGTSPDTTILLNELVDEEKSVDNSLSGVRFSILDVAAADDVAIDGRHDWLLDLPALPYAVIYREGQAVESFPTFHASYMLARLQRLAVLRWQVASIDDANSSMVAAD